MRKEITITAEARDSRGKNEARRLRAKGSMPAVLYGGAEGPTPVAVDPKEVSKILVTKYAGKFDPSFPQSVIGNIAKAYQVISFMR